ncbi:MAG: RdgB/HAM1 family non-canonical purine NTP pyrophosphatase [Oscillospiraceae bacterium]|nr:RdgB/HAM1 family non-canonical purine NTP pyrophosphatase [Ruminococcus sp.]MBQ7002867.1 RdgB/HAM1 family non-canonical purine NTP pyrophosphatase [Oscillospiraceae bacterium]MBQ7014447.1 RdgB/HAM1 family non-canonical purine NTP pyrophosphatase [Oscillospiraceae bacterium]
MNKIVLATNNANKLREVREILSPLGIEVLSQKEAGCNVNPEENGATFAENAAIKARAVFEAVSLPVIADDSGLCVDALDGGPGVYSARFAPEGEHCDKLLSVMADVPAEKRGAKFVTAIAYIDENGTLTHCSGECCGSIGYEKRGTNGFGYDPVFMYGDKSFAELSAEEKNAVSHRANALKALYALLQSEM